MVVLLCFAMDQVEDVVQEVIIKNVQMMDNFGAPRQPCMRAGQNSQLPEDGIQPHFMAKRNLNVCFRSTSEP